MSCSPFELKDYSLRELPAPQALEVEEHIRRCPACAEELDRLRLTGAALLSLREEEAPRRIAFAADAVPGVSGWRQWLDGFWTSAPRLGFASAAMLSVALIVFAVTRSAGQPVGGAATPPMTASISEADMRQRVQAAVDQAVRDLEARQSKKVETLVANFLQREEDDRKLITRLAEERRYMENRNGKLLSDVRRLLPAGGVAQ